MLINKDIDKKRGEWVTDDMAGKYEDIESHQPSTQSMRLRWSRLKSPHIEYYSELGHGDWGLYDRIRGYISKRIGQKFDDVYSAFRKDPRFRDNHIVRNETPSGIFRSLFASTARSGYPVPPRRPMAEYYIDEEGKIQEIPEPRKRRHNGEIFYRNPEPTITYIPRISWIRAHSEDIKKIHGPLVYHRLISNSITQEWIKRTLIPDLRKKAGIWKAKYPKLFDNQSYPYYDGGDPGDFLSDRLFFEVEYKDLGKWVVPGSAEHEELREKTRIVRSRKKEALRTYREYLDNILKRDNKERDRNDDRERRIFHIKERERK